VGQTYPRKAENSGSGNDRGNDIRHRRGAAEIAMGQDRRIQGGLAVRKPNQPGVRFRENSFQI
jgi:hypothetical protein